MNTLHWIRKNWFFLWFLAMVFWIGWMLGGKPVRWQHNDDDFPPMIVVNPSGNGFTIIP